MYLGRTTPLIKHFAGASPPRHQLVCFPYAGGGASFYRPWQDELPPEVDLLAVQYPGREERIDDPLIDDMDELAGLLATELAPLLDLPFTFFGHSMGAAVGYEIARRWGESGFPTPDRLIVSSQFAPPRIPVGDLLRHDDSGVLDELVRLGGVPRSVYESPELVRLIVSVVRNDYQVLESCRFGADAPALDLPVTAFCGADDPVVTPQDVREWAAFTRAGFTNRTFDGGHFYPRERLTETVAAVTELLALPAR
ncbi:pyochelin biosynthetic protein PchC [Streptomyces sp. SceaMP-e96]|uniref:thioesterase II family protein n=1 Tax=unclassified Streptomyces TaxID=2593676 RepID=UPI00082381DD|nr:MULTISPECIES: alpha/beta fold hydrolase [unclassified Streptomyces]MYT14310.1 alpha/beta fold hydrolase [Streptomyces sp. SID4951]SCK59417.1 pyochelin biosynthetic protein PchC [Streptomyces sp. SceaMP-e96]